MYCTYEEVHVCVRVVAPTSKPLCSADGLAWAGLVTTNTYALVTVTRAKKKPGGVAQPRRPPRKGRHRRRMGGNNAMTWTARRGRSKEPNEAHDAAVSANGVEWQWLRLADVSGWIRDDFVPLSGSKTSETRCVLRTKGQ